jgi:hypothetical protein
MEEEVRDNDLSRRRLLKRMGAGAAIAWSAPVLQSLVSPAFAQYGTPAPECQGATCATFIPCSSGNPDCVCVSTDEGGFCIPGSTQCAGLPLCPGGTSAECPAGTVCAVGTCCGQPVCVALALTNACPRPEGNANATRESSGPGTVGG